MVQFISDYLAPALIPLEVPQPTFWHIWFRKPSPDPLRFQFVFEIGEFGVWAQNIIGPKQNAKPPVRQRPHGATRLHSLDNRSQQLIMMQVDPSACPHHYWHGKLEVFTVQAFKQSAETTSCKSQEIILGAWGSCERIGSFRDWILEEDVGF